MVKSQGVYVSLIIPAFNEEARIGRSLDRIFSFLQSQPYLSEVIVVDDGSQDRTVEQVREIGKGKDHVDILYSGKHLGKGGAVRSGMLQAKGKYLFFSDADLSVPIETLSLFLAPLERESDVTIGTRQKSGATIEVHQPFHREFMGKVFTRLSNWILGLRLSDYTCGFKGFRKDAAKELFYLQRLNNWSFDAEILYLAHLKGYRVLEIPVTWRDDRATKVRLWRDVVTSFLGLLQIRLYDYQGKYK